MALQEWCWAQSMAPSPAMSLLSPASIYIVLSKNLIVCLDKVQLNMHFPLFYFLFLSLKLVYMVKMGAQYIS